MLFCSNWKPAQQRQTNGYAKRQWIKKINRGKEKVDISLAEHIHQGECIRLGLAPCKQAAHSQHCMA
jgi:hypothetical protein